MPSYVTGLLQDDTYETPDRSSHDRPEDAGEATDTNAGDTSDTNESRKKTRSKKPQHAFADVDVSPLHPRIGLILDEVCKLKPDSISQR